MEGPFGDGFRNPPLQEVTCQACLIREIMTLDRLIGEVETSLQRLRGLKDDDLVTYMVVDKVSVACFRGWKTSILRNHREDRSWYINRLSKLPGGLEELNSSRMETLITFTESGSNIQLSAPSGHLEVLAELLLAIAHGLATCGWRQDEEGRWWQDGHWWLMSPADRKGAGWTLPVPADLQEVGAANRLLPECKAPCVRLTDASTFEWVPFEGGYYFDEDGGRKIIIRVEEGARTGTIEWCSGKEGGSSFIASILILLPGAQADGEINRLLEAEDKKEALRIATVRAAKASGVTGAIVEPDTGYLIASAEEVARGGDFHPGRQPRRSWTPQGQERRFARWLKPQDWERLVAQATQLPWRQRD